MNMHSVTTAQRLEGIGEYYFSKKLREIAAMDLQGDKVINLGIGSPDLPPHPDVLQALQVASARPDVHAYQSYKGSPVLRRAVAEWYARWYQVALDPDRQVLPLIGSKEGILHICMTYLDPGDLALVPNPGYPTYRSAVRLANGEVLEYRLEANNDWYPDFDALQTLVTAHTRNGKKVKLMFVNYPHMPTGKLPKRTTLQRLVDFARQHNILLVHDNPYSFILNDEPMSLLSVEGAMDVAMELNSLSKSHNMAGWRVGMLCAAGERIDEVLRFKSNMDSGMFLPVQLAAAKALSLGPEWHQEVNRIYESRRQEARFILEGLGCEIAPGQAGMFLWARIPDRHADGYALSDVILQQARVFITPGGIFGDAGDRYLRISLCSPVETLQAAMKRIHNSLNKANL